MEEAKKLLEKYKAGNCTPREKELLLKWFHHLGEEGLSGLDDKDLIEAQEAFRADMKYVQRKSYIFWPRIVAAAAVLILISFGLYFYSGDEDTSAVYYSESGVVNDIAPGGNKATLLLADGRRISLTDADNGELAEQSGIKITKAADGQLVYLVTDPGNGSSAPLYNTIETPAGGQYQVNLPDGSKVWLNSSSSLRYPVRFTGNERKVEITGEAYFEVAHNKDMPFKVMSNDQTVEVLGTHFNVMAYPDEASTNTTLVEGSVRVVRDNNSRVISPGQQAQIRNGDINVVSVDIDEVTAWKNGYFVFKSEDIENIMRQIARWYDVEVDYEGTIPKKIFGGRISRTRNISEVLKILELTGSIHFKIISGDSPEEERRIIVMP